ncbi:DNRLRE domain-containing protein [Glycomyces luteolus]|uniref:DNRLRE domain-containing protein n=1 Tax=Glycomyces luteolus TaxID=2670330 RepID=A0A9X3PAV3_9ACTN|nr:LamG-like jellyroll fold domain-containing protein [Glycomyces luteolus]MDA1360272.1 DNRLRE domain-containing protein [Glycomyces luteolus]
MSTQLNHNPARRPALEKTRTLMQLPRTRRVWKIAGTGVLTLALTASLATWPWNRADLPQAEAQEEQVVETDGVADTEAEAIAEAEASGASVEVLNLRSELRDVVAEPDGSLIATEYAAPVRTMIGGVWADIDPTLVVSADGTIAPKATTVQMRFSAGGDQPLVTLANNGHTFTLDWAGDLPEPTVDGSSAIYAEVLPGVDLHLTALDGGFTHTLVVKSSEAAANAALQRIEWPVTLDGTAVETTPDGGVAMVDEGTLDAWLSADSPTMWDSSGVDEAVATVPYLAGTDLSDPVKAMQVAADFGRQAEVGISGSGSSIVLSPDTDLLNGAETVYPVYIDPVYRDEYRSAQAMVASKYPDESYWNWTGEQGVGYCVGLGSCEKKRLFYRVSSSFYQGKTVLSATFGATLYHNYYGEKTGDVADLYLMSSGISSSTDWNNQPSGSKVDSKATPEPSYTNCDYSSAHATEWDVTSELQNAAGNGTSTLTFGIRNASESDATKWMRFCHNGHLRVKYNTPPDTPIRSNLWTDPGAVCPSSVTADAYVNEWPTLFTRAYDDDNGDTNEWGSDTGSGVSEKLRVRWLLSNTSNQVIYTSGLSSSLTSGSKFQLPLASIDAVNSLPSGTTIKWQAIVYDGLSSSSLSPYCYFVYDNTKPSAPSVTSGDFTLGTTAAETADPMVGELGSITIATTETNVESFSYSFDEATPTSIPLAGAKSATGTFMPTTPGDHLLEVTATDAAGNSVAKTYSFLTSVPEPVGVWSLGDAAGSASVANGIGNNPGSVGSGVTLGGAGPKAGATVATFNGTTNAFIDTTTYSVASTGEGVSIAAWAKVTNLAKDGVVASVDGGLGEAGMILGYRSTSATTGQWVVSMPDMAMDAFTAWEVVGGQVTTTNQSQWVHLIGVWNDATSQMSLYINGARVGSALRQSTWWGDGTVQIGRANFGGAWGDNFSGAIADVRVFDRVVVAGEAEYLGWQLATRKGLWQFNNLASDGVSTAEFNGGLSAKLFGGAYLNFGPEYVEGIPVTTEPIPLVGAGDMILDGVNDYASVASPIVDTSRSFTISARVRLSTVTADKTMTVLSIPGTNSSAIEVVYEPKCGESQTPCWALRLRTGDSTDANGEPAVTLPPVENTEVDPVADTQGQWLTAVFDGTTGQARLYVGSSASDPLTAPFLSSWQAGGNLQIGRGFTGGSYGEYFSGAIDDVRGYAGVLHPSVIARLSLATNDDRPNI